MDKKEITKELLHQKYSYCPIDIARPLVHRNGSRNTKRGDPAGTLVQSYYRMGHILETRSMSIHRAVWLYKHPGCYKESEVPPTIDHINMNKQDNRYENLRPVSRNFNSFNRKRSEGGSSYYRGVSLIKTSGRWKVSIRIGGKRRHIGVFPGTPEGEIAAALAWDRAAFKLYGEDAISSLNFPDDKANYMGLDNSKQLEFVFSEDQVTQEVICFENIQDNVHTSQRKHG